MEFCNSQICHYLINTSHVSVREGIALADDGLSPYAGDVFHEVIKYINFVWYIGIDNLD